MRKSTMKRRLMVAKLYVKTILRNLFTVNHVAEEQK